FFDDLCTSIRLAEASLSAAPQKSRRIGSTFEKAEHTFTGNGPGVIGADNCQICGRWLDHPETDACKNTPAATIALRAARPESGWRSMGSAPKTGERILLAWRPVGGISEHVELGKWRDRQGWSNTYGHAFSGDPDVWAPLAPFAAAPTAEGEKP